MSRTIAQVFDIPEVDAWRVDETPSGPQCTACTHRQSLHAIDGDACYFVYGANGDIRFWESCSCLSFETDGPSEIDLAGRPVRAEGDSYVVDTEAF